MDTIKFRERVMSVFSLIFEMVLSGVKSITLLSKLSSKEYTLHKNDRSLVHRLLDVENPANKIATHTIIKPILLKSTLPELILLLLIIGSNIIAIDKLFVKTQNTKSSPIFSKTYFDHVLKSIFAVLLKTYAVCVLIIEGTPVIYISPIKTHILLVNKYCHSCPVARTDSIFLRRQRYLLRPHPIGYQLKTFLTPTEFLY